jgi:CBS domain-containing protein
MTTVADVLREKKNTRIITVRVRETVATAVTLMTRENVHALVVKDVCRTEGNTVVGIFSERNLAKALGSHGASALDMPIATFVSGPLVDCTMTDSVERVLQLMDEHQVRLLPVIESHALSGVISISDVIRHLVRVPALAA